MQNKTFITNKTLNLRGQLVDLTEPKVMGILNSTPDSFYVGSRFSAEKDILSKAEEMLSTGATFLDVGGYSSRPGATDISEGEEAQRVILAIRCIIKEFPKALISIDTFRSSIANAAVNEGASMINDISGGSIDPQMISIVAQLKVPYVLMHMLGTPQTMTSLTNYNNLLKEVTDFFHQKIAALKAAGVTDIVVDPGFGFAKTVEQNFELLNNLEHFNRLGKPVLVGLSRKSMIWKTLSTTAEDSGNGTTVLNTLALTKGARILRVHDVKEAVESVKLFSKTSAASYH